MAQQPMYPGIVNSPMTELAEAIDDTQDTIEVADGNVLPDAPNLAVIGAGENAETILYVTKSGNILSDVTRGFQGAARSWQAGAKIARRFTAYDYDSLRENVVDVNSTLNEHKDDYANPHKVTSDQINCLPTNSHTVEDSIHSYPLGITIFYVLNNFGGWKKATGATTDFGWVITYRLSESSGHQEYVEMYTGTDPNNTEGIKKYIRVKRNVNEFWQPFTRFLTTDDNVFPNMLHLSNPTIQYSNYLPMYRKLFSDEIDTNWKRFATVTIPTGPYRAASFEVTVTDLRSNYGHLPDIRKRYFYATCRRSTGTQDVPDDALIYGTSDNFFRIVKTSTGVYELQVRRVGLHTTAMVECKFLDRGSSNTLVVFDDELVDGSTSGTIYTPTLDYTINTAQLSLHGEKVFVKAGEGSPEGVVSAPKGSIYLNYGTGPSSYTKESGSGNTGWKAVQAT